MCVIVCVFIYQLGFNHQHIIHVCLVYYNTVIDVHVTLCYAACVHSQRGSDVLMWMVRAQENIIYTSFPFRVIMDIMIVAMQAHANASIHIFL